MAQMALARSTRPELRRLAQAIISNQSAEISQMAAYLKDWYGLPVPTKKVMTSQMMADLSMPMLHGAMPGTELGRCSSGPPGRDQSALPEGKRCGPSRI